MGWKYKTLPVRHINFNNVSLHSHTEVLADISYQIDGDKNYTCVTQPVMFSFCEMKWLAERFHSEIIEKLQKQLDDARVEMSAK
jgi:hypothetical protein